MKCLTCRKEFVPQEDESDYWPDHVELSRVALISHLNWRANFHGYCSWICESRDSPEDNEAIDLAIAKDELDYHYAKHVRTLKKPAGSR